MKAGWHTAPFAAKDWSVLLDVFMVGWLEQRIRFEVQKVSLAARTVRLSGRRANLCLFLAHDLQMKAKADRISPAFLNGGNPKRRQLLVRHLKAKADRISPAFHWQIGAAWGCCRSSALAFKHRTSPEWRGSRWTPRQPGFPSNPQCNSHHCWLLLAVVGCCRGRIAVALLAWPSCCFFQVLCAEQGTFFLDVAPCHKAVIKDVY